MADKINHERLLKVVKYDALTGIFVWIISPSQAVKAGQQAGALTPSGYRQIGIEGAIYLEHHLAFFYTTGEWPLLDIDHINGNKSDNRIDNLRQATKAQNSWNAKLCVKNKSGYKGVHWYPPTNKWAAQIRVNKKRIHLGYFTFVEDAAKVIKEARERLHIEFYNHGTAI